MPVTDVRFTEIMYNPAGGSDTQFEFIEITNTGTDTFNITNWQIGNSDFGPEVFFAFDSGAIFLGPGQSAIIAPSGTDQATFESLYGPLPAGTVFINAAEAGPSGGSLGLSNSGETITLISGFDGPADAVSYPDIAEGTIGAELSVGISFDAAGNQVFTSQAPNPGVAGAVAPPPPPPAAPTNGDDTLVGTDGDDTINLLGGRDSYEGGAGNDMIDGSDGNDAIDGGQDDDTITLGQGNDNAWGGEGNDTLFGGSGLDRLNGNSGDDEIYGGKGGDIIQGGKGEDYIDGGRQSDSISGGEQSDEIYGGVGNDTINGDEGADLLYGGSGGDLINGGSFDDIIYGDHGADKLNGGSGDDVVYGGKSNDKVNGNSGDDQLFGDSGNDNLTGGSGNDFLDGGSQADRLDGGTGEDILIGGLSNDELTGGADADTFVFAGVVNDDVITDFEVGVDKIDLSGYGPVTLEEAISIAVQTTDGVSLDLGQFGSVLLEGISLGDLSLNDFVFIEDLPLLPEPPAIEDPINLV